jgi:hypothetical protein
MAERDYSEFNLDGPPYPGHEPFKGLCADAKAIKVVRRNDPAKIETVNTPDKKE